MTTQTILAGIFSHDEWIEPEEIVFSSGATVSVAKCSLRFEKVGGDPAFGNKPLVEFEGEALYPELAILRLLQKHGFDGVWVDTYRSKLWGAMSAEQILPDHAREVYGRILQARDGRPGGFWDVFAWKEGKFYSSSQNRTPQIAEIRLTKIRSDG
jgi:hypothetical protein